jgi:hypothetical protein
MIDTDAFSGWKDVAALVAHLKFVKDYHRKIQKVPAVSDHHRPQPRQGRESEPHRSLACGKVTGVSGATRERGEQFGATLLPRQGLGEAR